MPNSAGEPEPTEGPLESSGSEESDQVENRSLSKEEEPATQASASGEATAEAQDWWSEQPASDWAQSAGSAPDTEPAIPKESTTADVYFCGHTTLLSLSRASSDREGETHRCPASVLGPGVNRAPGAGWRDCFRDDARP